MSYSNFLKIKNDSTAIRHPYIGMQQKFQTYGDIRKCLEEWFKSKWSIFSGRESTIVRRYM